MKGQTNPLVLSVASQSNNQFSAGDIVRIGIMSVFGLLVLFCAIFIVFLLLLVPLSLI